MQADIGIDHHLLGGSHATGEQIDIYRNRALHQGQRDRAQLVMASGGDPVGVGLLPV